MSVFTPAACEYLRGQSLRRFATVGPGDQPHVVPVTFWFNADEDTIDIGGINFAAGKKWRDAQHNPKVTFLVDDTPGPGRARAVEIRGEAELHNSGGKEINPRFPNFAEEFFRIRPTRIVSWGLEEEGGPQSATSFRPNARSVR